MKVLTVPRSAVALEYKALRFPAQLVETKLIAPYLPAESGVRLAFERFLGALDSTAGSLLGDQALADRGRALSRRADVIEKAAVLEDKARARKDEADAQLSKENKEAEAEKARIQQEHERKAAQLKLEREAARKAVEQKADAREKAEAAAITSKAQATIAAERDRLDEQEAKIAARVEARTAAPKAQLKKAVTDTQTAQQKKADADRLAQLAETERSSRKA